MKLGPVEEERQRIGERETRGEGKEFGCSFTVSPPLRFSDSFAVLALRSLDNTSRRDDIVAQRGGPQDGFGHRGKAHVSVNHQVVQMAVLPIDVEIAANENA